MQIWIHDSKMKKIVALNNDIPEMLHYSNSAWHPYLEQATSTFDFTIPKFVNGKLHEDIKLITDECFVSFYINGSHQVFYIATLQEDDFNIQLTCNNTNLEYALEYANPFSVDSAQTIEWYLNHMDLLSFAAVEIGINEISDRKRTLTFDSQETKAIRLQSLMSSFEAEYEFKVDLNRDGTYKRIVINIYQKSDETHHGIGSVRGDVVLYYDNGLKGVQVNSDKTQMFNAGVFTGKDGLSLADVEISEKNADGVEEFYSRKGNPCLYAPLAMNRYRATMRAEGQDNWIRKDFTTEYENINDLKAYALRTLKQYAYPLMTYTASVQSNFIGQYTDLKLGDTVKIIDNNFAGGLALEARVSEMIISFDNPNNNSLVFTNYRKIDNKPTSALQSRIDQAVESKLPYRIELATTGGVTFKNNEGESVIEPKLYKGNKPFTTDVSWRWALDSNVTVGMQYLVKAKDIDETAVLTVAGYVGNTEVATTEITLTNVNDGPQGPQGEQGPQGHQGADGKTSYVHTAWAYSADGTDGFTTVYPNLNLLDGTKDFSGDWTNSYVLTNDGAYKGLTVKKRTDQWMGIYKTFTAPKDGIYTFSAYVKSSGDNANIQRYVFINETPVFSNDIIKSLGSNFDWLRDSFSVPLKAGDTTLARYEISGQGSLWTAGHKWEEGSVATPWMPSASEVKTSDYPNYIGQYTNFVQEDSQNPSDYTWFLIRGNDGPQGPKGDQGIPGVKGADGKTQYTHIAYADDDTGGGFSQTDQNKAYIGMYQDFTEADSNDPTKYRWTKWKGSDGAQGIPGKPGADGKTPYIHFAYADDSKGTNFSLTDKNQQYQGYYSDYTQADSTDYTKYKWVDRLANVKVGGRNLAQGTSKDWSKPFTGFSGVQNTRINLYKVLVDSLSVGDTLKSRIILKYTNITPASGKTATIWLQGNGDVTNWNAGAYSGSPAKPISGSGEMVFEHEFKITADHLKNNNWNWQFRTDYIASGSLQWKLAKVEKGTVFSDWSPALEDTQEQIDSKADQTLTQDQLNALAEKNNLIKAEMEAKATIDTVNQWITAYQNYVNANDADKAKSEQALKDASERILAIRYEVDNLKVVWDAIDTYMSFQNEGLVIGKKDGSAYAKFSDDRISLFSGSSEVMYISQGTLNIANGIFTKTIQIGRFRFETHPADADMLVVRFVGG